MNNFRLRFFCLILSVIFLTAVVEFVCAEDNTTAHLSFKKSATLKTKTRPYVVKKGEWLFDILRTQVGITSRRFTIIKQLNPHIKDIDKIEPGDTVMLPDIEPPGTAKREDTSTETASATSASVPSDSTASSSGLITSIRQPVSLAAKRTF